MLRALWAGGVRHFDCASPAEVALVRQMFPKPASTSCTRSRPGRRSARRRAPRRARLRARQRGRAGEDPAETGGKAGAGRPRPVRAAGAAQGRRPSTTCPASSARRRTRRRRCCARPGRTRPGSASAFHVGSQCLEPLGLRRALGAGRRGDPRRPACAVDIVDVGGGFPVSYPGVTPPALGAFIAEIEARVRRARPAGAHRACGPSPAARWSRAGGSVVVQVQAPRRRALRERRRLRQPLGRRPAGASPSRCG